MSFETWSPQKSEVAIWQRNDIQEDSIR